MNKIKQRTTQLLLLALLLVGKSWGQAGISCLNPKTISLTAGQSTGWKTTGSDSLWLTFVADTTIHKYVINTNLKFKKRVVGAYLKNGCNVSDGLNPAFQVNDSTFLLYSNNLIVGQSYKMLLISAIDNSCICPDSMISGYSTSIIKIDRSSNNLLNDFVCGNEYLLPYNPNSATSMANFVATYNAQRDAYLNSNTTQSGSYVIPVVVHIIEGNYTIQYDQIQSAIASLNAGFQKNYPAYNGGTHGPYAVNTDIQFCLAQTPMGTTWTNDNEKGVMRYSVLPIVQNHFSNAVGQTQLLNTTHPTASHFPFKNYLNIWVVPSINSGSWYGYSNYPNSGAILDGIVIAYNVFGDNTQPNSNFTLDPIFDDGTMLVHEAGHYLNLLHTFDQVNPTNIASNCLGMTGTDCATYGDLICDTPPVRPINKYLCSYNSCYESLPAYGNTDIFDISEDYMSYGQGCLNTFTYGQKERMQVTLNTPWPAGRADMVSSVNSIATGGCCTNTNIAIALTYSSNPCTLTYTMMTISGCYFYDAVYVVHTSTSADYSPIITVPQYVYTFPSPGTYTLEVYPIYEDGTILYDKVFFQVVTVPPVIPSPTVVVTPSITSICSGYNTTLTASGATNFTWANSTGVIGTTSVIVVSPTVPTNYTVIGTNICGTSTKMVQVNMIPNYTLSILANPNPVCAGQSVTLTASGGTTTANSYTWQASTSTITTAINPYVTAPTVATTYTVSSKNSCGVISTKTVAITINPTPTINAVASPTAICAATTATLTASGATSYTWMPGSNTAVNYTVNPSTTTIYTLTGATAGCKATKTVTLTIISSPTIAVNPTSTLVCPGQPVTLTASGANSYTWSTGANTSSVSVIATSNTVYTVTGANNCSLTTKTATITTMSSPTISITTPTIPSLCLATGSSSIVTLVASPTPTNATVTWAATAGTLTIPIGQYTVTGNTIKYNVSAYTTGTVPINFCATASSGGCSTSTCTMVYPCCPTTTATNKYVNKTFTVTPSIPTGTVVFSGTITVNSGVSLTLQSCNIYVDPNTKFILNGNATFDTRNSYMHGCFAMWDGIYANNTSTIRHNQSVITDAMSAVNDFGGGANILLTGNYFNKNQQSVYFGAVKTSTSTVTLTNNLFTCTNLSLTTTTPWFSSQPNLTNAPAFGSYSITTMLPPYVNKNSAYGVFLNGAGKTGATNSAITIGGIAGQENVFDKVKVGVLANSSNAQLQNNMFQNLNSATNNAGVPITYGAGVLAYSGAFNNTVTIGGSSSALKNTFVNNDYGVYSYLFTSTSVSYNTFSTQATGVYISSNNNNSVANTNNNNLYNCLVGINYDNNGTIDATIKDNNIDNSSFVVGTYNTNFAIRATENAQPTNSNTFAKYTINNNNIKNYYNGIMSAQTLSTSIIDNEVHMIQDYGNSGQFGIRAENCNTPRIYNNMVDMPALYPAWWQVGVECKTNSSPRVQCNSVTNVGIALKFEGSNTTVAGDGIIGNLMQNNGYGIWLANNGEIGNQFKTVGTYTYSADNSWNGYTCFPTQCYYTFTQENSNTFNGTGALLFTRSTGIYNLPNSFVSNFPGTNSFNLSGTNNSASYTVACSANTYSTPSNLKLGTNSLVKLMQGGEDDADDYNQQGANMGQTATNNLTAIDDIYNNAVSKRAIKHYQLYRNIQLQNIDSTGSSKLSGFINSAKNQNTGLFFAVDSLLHRAERDSNFIASAKFLNNSITIKNKVDKTHKEFNSLYVNYLAQHNSLQPSEIKALENVALLCPTIYGTAVYQARTVLFHITRKSYLSDCEKIGPTPSTKKLGQFEVNNDEVIVYPNPATNELYIDANGYSEVTFKLYNMMGALILDKTVLTNQSLPLANVANGVYTYKVFANGTELKADKLIIIK